MRPKCQIWMLDHPCELRNCKHNIFTFSLNLDDNKIKKIEKSKSILNCDRLIKHEWTLEEIGECWGLTRERIRQIERDAFIKICKKLKIKHKDLRKDLKISFSKILEIEKKLKDKKDRSNLRRPSD